MIINADCLDSMRSMEPNSISCIVTDPPYGLGFMGKEWDSCVVPIPCWKEMLRVVKPGGFLLAFGGTRTFHRQVCAIEDAGWEVRDCIMWLYGSGFPKSHNHFGIEGYGTALKPAYEPIVVAMKKCDGTFKQNAEKWGQAGINIRDSRVGTDIVASLPTRRGNSDKYAQDQWTKSNVIGVYKESVGRWPANLILDEEAGAMLDEQSGFSKSRLSVISRPRGVMQMSGQNSRPCHGVDLILKTEGVNDSGGASRFFYCAKASAAERNLGLEDREPVQTTDGCIRANQETAAKYQANSFARKNPHPTVKPLKLMEYLIKLVMPPKDGILLDPFCGSGSTLLAAKNLGVNAIGMERDEGYCKIARARLGIE